VVVGLEVLGAESAENVRVTISKDSEVIVTPIGPASLALGGHAQFRDERMNINLHARNEGLRARDVRLTFVTTHADGRVTRFEHADPSGVGARATKSYNLTYEVEGQANSVFVETSWATGGLGAQRLYTGRSGSWSWPDPPLEFPLVIVALVILWIVLPASLADIRQAVHPNWFRPRAHRP
jgi:hypothetical protein